MEGSVSGGEDVVAGGRASGSCAAALCEAALLYRPDRGLYAVHLERWWVQRRMQGQLMTQLMTGPSSTVAEGGCRHHPRRLTTAPYPLHEQAHVTC